MKSRIALLAAACRRRWHSGNTSRIRSWSRGSCSAIPRRPKVLKEINSLTAYQVPNLPLKIDTNYANTPEDVEPLRRREAVQAALPDADGVHRAGTRASPSRDRS